MSEAIQRVNGLHHITAISGPAQENLDFYAGILGMRLVKRSVNQDDPGTYHLFYADAEGHPGSDLTFFPWAHMAPPRLGHGLAVEVGLEVPVGSLEYWASRLDQYSTPLGNDRDPVRRQGAAAGRSTRPEAVAGRTRRGARARRSRRGTAVPCLGSGRSGASTARKCGSASWRRPARSSPTCSASSRSAVENGWTRYGFRDAAGVIDVRETPDERRGAWGVGAVHHLAWRVDDEQHQLAVRARVEAAGGSATPVIDRFWFKSVYFKEPGGVLFELATDGPGFGVDEDMAHLGETLVLPPWLEAERSRIQQMLPALTLPVAASPG